MQRTVVTARDAQMMPEPYRTEFFHWLGLHDIDYRQCKEINYDGTTITAVMFHTPRRLKPGTTDEIDLYIKTAEAIEPMP